MATHSSIHAWRILWTEEPGELQSMGLQRAGHNYSTHTRYVKRLKTKRFTWSAPNPHCCWRAGLAGPFYSWGNWASERWGKLPGSPWKLSWGGDLKCWSQSARAFQATKDPVLFAPWEDLISLGLCLTMSLGPALAGNWTSACASVQGAGGPDVPWGWWCWNHRGSGCSSQILLEMLFGFLSSHRARRGGASKIPSDLRESLPFRSSSAGWPLGGAGREDFWPGVHACNEWWERVPQGCVACGSGGYWFVGHIWCTAVPPQ